MSGRTVPVDKPFRVEGDSLMYPGDPAGSGKNVINCHCGIIPKMVKSKPRAVAPAEKPVRVKKPPVKPKAPVKPKVPVKPKAPDYTPPPLITVEERRMGHKLTSNEVTAQRLLSDDGEAGVNQTYKIKIKGDGSAAFKPLSGERSFLTLATGGPLYIRERAAYIINRDLGMDQVPITVIRKHGGQIGSAQHWQPGTLGSNVSRSDITSSIAGKAYEHERAKMAFFDDIIGNEDRHGGNYLVEKKTGKIHAIDNGFSLYTRPDRYATGKDGLKGYMEGLLESQRADLKQRLERMASHEYTKRLIDTGLEASAARNVRSRVAQAVANFKQIELWEN